VQAAGDLAAGRQRASEVTSRPHDWVAKALTRAKRWVTKVHAAENE